MEIILCHFQRPWMPDRHRSLRSAAYSALSIHIVQVTKCQAFDRDRSEEIRAAYTKFQTNLLSGNNQTVSQQDLQVYICKAVTLSGSVYRVMISTVNWWRCDARGLLDVSLFARQIVTNIHMHYWRRMADDCSPVCWWYIVCDTTATVLYIDSVVEFRTDVGMCLWRAKFKIQNIPKRLRKSHTN